MIRIALVGCGWHTINHHAPALARFRTERQVPIEVSVCDTDADRAEVCRAQFSFARRHTPESLAQQDFEAAILVLPANALLRAAGDWLSRGIPTLIEKPLGDNLTEARAIADLASAHPGRVMVSMNRRFDPGLALALDWISKQSPIAYVHGSMSRVSRSERDFLWSTGIHLLDTLNFVAGPFDPATCSAARVPECAGRCGVVSGRNGIPVGFQILPVSGRMEERLQVVGGGWSVEVWTGTSHPWRVQAFTEGRPALDRSASPDDPECVRNGTYQETGSFLEAVISRHPLPGPTPADVLPGAEVAERIWNGRW